MLQQTVFPFKLKRTEEKISARSGLALFAEFFEAMGEDVRQIREDASLRETIQPEDIPSSSATGDWLKREAQRGGIEGMEKLPSEDFGGNALYFCIGILTYNLFIAQKYLTMPKDWRAKSIRWLLVEVGGKLIRHGRSLTLKIAASLEKCMIYLEMRRKTYELLLE
jgi:hypothetical protein